MSISQWIERLLPDYRGLDGTRRDQARKPRCLRRPYLEQLEERTLLSVIAVSRADPDLPVGVTGNRGSFLISSSSVSQDGRYVAFTSEASNLVSDDTNNYSDVFMYDRQTQVTTLVSVDSSGNQANGASFQSSISSDGRFVAFFSQASNLVSDDTNDTTDVFVHDRLTGATNRASIDSSGNQGNNNSQSPSISGDGRYVTFSSWADNLVTADTNGYPDVFMHDLLTQTTTRVSVNSLGDEGNADSMTPSISEDGRYVAFSSWADNLASGDTNGSPDVFVYDRLNQTTTLVSVNSNGDPGDSWSYHPSISKNGRFIAFTSFASNLVSGASYVSVNVYVHDRLTGEITHVSVDSSGNPLDLAWRPSISDDGRHIAFWGYVNSTPNYPFHILVYDQQNQSVTQQMNGLSAGPFYSQWGSWWTEFESDGPSISGDGLHVAFSSIVSDLISNDDNFDFDVFVYDVQTTQVDLVSHGDAGLLGNQFSFVETTSSVSHDGRYVTFQSHATNLVSGDTNNTSDVFVYDRHTQQTTRVSVGSNGIQSNSGSSNPTISADGRYVAFESNASTLVSGDTNGFSDVFIYDRQTQSTTRVSVNSNGEQSNGFSYLPSISSDGRYVAFQSDATNLVGGDTNNASDVFVYDRQTQQTTRVSVDSSGIQGNSGSGHASISGDGRYVAFLSDASNLVSGDTNGVTDAFIYDRQTQLTTRVSVSSNGEQSHRASEKPAISGDGRYVVFLSYANNLVSGDTNDDRDVFVYDRQTQQTTRVSVDSSGIEGNSSSGHASISGDGRYVAYFSYASNLVSDDTNNYPDIFVYDRLTEMTTRVSINSNGDEGNDSSITPSLSADGRYVAFVSWARNLVSGDKNDKADVFLVSLADPGSTPVGSNVAVQPVDPATGETVTTVDIQFDNVTQSGTTSVNVTSEAPPLPKGFTLTTSSPIYYDITTTATFDGSALVCVSYAGLSAGDPSSLRLFHYENGAWEDRTTSIDTTNEIICATVTSFSPFAILRATAEDDTAVTTEDSSVSIAVLDNDGDAVSILAFAQAERGSVVLNADGTFTYSPGADIHGADSFTYTISHSHGGFSTATVTITITAVNDAPVAANDTAATTEDGAVSFNALANDSDVDGDVLTITSFTHGARGTVVLNSDGTFTYTPGVAAGEDGIDSFTYTIADGQGGTATATITITIAKAVADGAMTIDSHGVVRIGGTAGDDTIILTAGDGRLLRNGQDTGIELSGISEIRVWGRDGNDAIDVSNLSIHSLLHSGNGNDSLTGGSGHDVLIGGAGNGMLVGGKGDDFLVGGFGADRLVGSAGNDVLVSGKIDNLLDLEALRAISRDWSLSRSVHDETVDDILDDSVWDGDGDRLTGSSGADLFFVDDEDVITDFKLGKGQSNKDGDVVVRNGVVVS